MCPHAHQELFLSDEMPPGSLVVFGKEAMEKAVIDEQCVLKVVKSLWIIFIFNLVIFSSWYWHLYLQCKACCNPLHVSHLRIQFYNSLRLSVMFDKNQKSQLIESGKFTQCSSKPVSTMWLSLPIAELSGSNAILLLNIASITTLGFSHSWLTLSCSCFSFAFVHNDYISR